MFKKSSGFSLMELLIALVIVGILTAIAIPTYNHYSKRAYFSELLLALHPYRVAVIQCYIVVGDVTKCDAGKYYIPNNLSDGKGNIKSITVSKGEITIVPNAKNGLSEKDDYTLKPEIKNERIHWQTSGGAVKAGLAK